MVAVANLVFLTLAFIYLARTKPVYRASARLLVVQREGRPVGVAGGPHPLGNLASQQDTLSTHLMIIRSPIIIGPALERSRFEHLSMDRVIDRVRVRQASASSRVLDLEYQGASEDEALTLLREIIASYDGFLKEDYQKELKDVIALFSRARDELSGELKGLERSYLEFRKQNPTPSEEGPAPSHPAHRIEQWEEAVDTATVRALQLRTHLGVARKLSREGASPAEVAAALEHLAAFGVGMSGVGAPGTTTTGGGAEARGAEGPGATYEQVTRELFEVESRRALAERRLEHLRSQAAAMSRERPTRQDERRKAFASAPPVAMRLRQLDEARADRDAILRVARHTSDPAAIAARSRVRDLEREIGALWDAMKNRTDGAGDVKFVRVSEEEVVMLRAREAWLRERVEEVRSEELGRLRERRADLARRHGTGQPEVAAIDARVAALAAGTVQADARGRGPVSEMIAMIERSLAAVEATCTEYQERLDAAVAAHRRAEIDRLAEANIRYDLERQRTLFDSVAAQLKQAQLGSDPGGTTARVIDPPRIVPIRPSPAAALLLALALGTGCGAGAAWLVESLDARIRSISELRSAVGLPVLAIVPRVAPDELPSGGSCALLSHHSPRSITAESYKSARARLELVRRERSAQVLMITSPNPGDGKSTTASNLAICQAHAGRRTLLIDADLRRPSIHGLHGLGRGPGLSRILAGHQLLDAAIVPSGIPNLDVITSGPDVPNPADLLASPRLAEALLEARSLYDAIVIDTSPLLAVTDPWILSAAVDGLILVIRVDEVRRPELERAMDIVANLGSPALGVVLNRATPQDMGFDDRYYRAALDRIGYDGGDPPAGHPASAGPLPGSLAGPRESRGRRVRGGTGDEAAPSAPIIGIST